MNLHHKGKKFTRGKNMPFINKTIKKASMTRSRLKIYISQKPFTTNVYTREAIAYLSYEKQKLTII